MESLLSLLVLSVIVVASQGRFLQLFERDFDPFHRECGIESEERQPCGRKANRVSEIECKARSCCWEEEPEGDSPGCFLAKRMLTEECDVDYKEKDDCGYYGITEAECNMRECCYKPSALTNDPVCFYKKKPAEQLRLSFGPNEKTGVVELMHEGEWGSICDDMFGIEEATIVCKNLGFASGKPILEAGSQYGESEGMILLDSLECKGDEASLGECRHEGWGNHDCSHYEDAGVKCYNEGEEDEDSDEYNGGSGSGYQYYEYWDYRSARKPTK